MVTLPMSLRPQDPPALRVIFPNADPRTEVVIEDNHDGTGPWLIVYTIPNPFPTTPQLDAAYQQSLWNAVLAEIAPALTLVVAIWVRCQLSGIPFPAAWLTYYQGLRDIQLQPYPPVIPTQPPIPGGI